jgi:histidinol-phosphatase
VLQLRNRDGSPVIFVFMLVAGSRDEHSASQSEGSKGSTGCRIEGKEYPRLSGAKYAPSAAGRDYGYSSTEARPASRSPCIEVPSSVGGDVSNSVESDLAFAHDLADEADRVGREGFVLGRSVEHQVKADGSPVSAVDRAIEEALLELVRRDRPGDAFLGEEVGEHGDGPRSWLIDGIDGTSDFVAGSPLWSTLIALVEHDLPVLGLSTSSAQERRWWAARGRGAWTAAFDRSGAGVVEPMTVADRPGGRRPRAWLELLPGHATRPKVDRLLTRVESVSMTTHPACMVATGDLDVAVQVAGGAWDFAALMPLVWEAGGRCLDLDGVDVRVPQEPMVFVGRMEPKAVQELLGL